ncbi:MAG: RimK family alpha-L-glutamate ligase [Candidatus Bathyarchaeia archaeon]
MERMSIAVLVDEVTLGEVLIFSALKRKGIQARLIDATNSLPNVENMLRDPTLKGVINRVTRKNLRTFYAEELKNRGTRVLNPFEVEYISNSKLRTKQAFSARGVKTARFTLIPKFPVEQYSVGRLARHDRVEEIAEILEAEVGFPVVLKPSEGSRGKSVLIARSRDDFAAQCRKYRTIDQLLEIPYALYQTLSNPIGLFAEEFIPHPFDLRVLISMKGKSTSYLGCLARVGRSEDEVAKNTALGSIPVGVEIPKSFKDAAMNGLLSVVSYAEKTWSNTPACCIVGVDIIPRCDNAEARKEIYILAKTVSAFKNERIEEAKKLLNVTFRKLLKKHGVDSDAIMQDKGFLDAQKHLDHAFSVFRSLDGYKRLQEGIWRCLESSEPYLGELNTRIDFEVNTRNLCIPNLHENIVDLAAT